MISARPVTLQDIARRAGVSKMTVSLALRGHPHAAAATRDRLRRLATTMGYRPNPLISANMAQLRAGRRSAYAGTIAFSGAGASPVGMTADSQQRRVYLGAQRRAEALGYHIEWFALDDPGLDGRRLSEILKARGILGAILAANRVVLPRWHLDWDHFALAAIGRTEVGHELHRTMGDYYRALREICQRCRARGYRRIGLAVSQEHDLAHQSLHRSALLGCQAEWPRRDHVPVLIAEQWTEAPFIKWVRRHRPDVVIASEDDPVHWLQAAGIRVPDDIGLIRPHVNKKTLGIGGFLFDDAELGAAAVDLVVEQLHHNERGLPTAVKRVLLPGRWFEGRSLRPAPSEVASAG
jgi:LacI family transcriptional regulator